MLFTEKLLQALDAKSVQFTQGNSAFQSEFNKYYTALLELSNAFPSQQTLLAALNQLQTPAGALPAEQYDTCMRQLDAVPVKTFSHQFANHVEARNWAEQVITDIAVAAADGSQIAPWGDASLPIALAQAGLFVNPHSLDKNYSKQTFVEVLGPSDLAESVAENAEPVFLADQFGAEIINLRRFELECAALTQWMRSAAAEGIIYAKPPIALFDGSLIVSFAQTMQSALRSRYIRAVVALLQTSRETRIPLLGYIDSSKARDLAVMLHAAFPEKQLPKSGRISDAQLLQPLMRWGDATIPFLSARGDVLGGYAGEQVAFQYLRAAQDRPPARVEMPEWVMREGLEDYCLNILRAEIIIGGGYPYALETADALAVISLADRERFYGILQKYMEQNGIALSFSRKSLSKSRRR